MRGSGWAHLGSSSPVEAIAAFEKAVALSRDTIGLGYLGYAYGLVGRRDAATAVLQELLKRSASEEVPQTSLAYLYVGLGDFDQAFEALEKCLERRDNRLSWFPATIFSGAFLDDARYKILLRKLEAVRQAATKSL